MIKFLKFLRDNMYFLKVLRKFWNFFIVNGKQIVRFVGNDLSYPGEQIELRI